MLHITETLAIADWELSESFMRSSGPGGQNVNKVSTAVELATARRSAAKLGCLRLFWVGLIMAVVVLICRSPF